MSEGRVERRLAAILAADVVGYSRLMGQDEAGTLARLKSLRRDLIDPRIASHKGRIVKTTGDGILIEFPSVVEAVACAAEFQREMTLRNVSIAEEQRIVFRVGINLGDVIVEDDDIHGDGVNVAARLEGLAEPGGISVSSTVYDHVQGRLELGFEDSGEQKLKNIARAVRVYRVRLDDSVAPATTPAPTTLAPARLDKPSIAVLPFQNMSGDPEHEHFADGIVEEIITALSRISWLFVIARNTSFTYKGQTVDVKQVGHDLGARYVLEGSVRKGGNRLRVTVQLIEVETGAHLWADRFDGSPDDMLDLQDQVAMSVAGAVEPALEGAERTRAANAQTSELSAYALCQQATALFGTKSRVRDALRLLERATVLDPDYAPALGLSAVCYMRLLFYSLSEDPEADRRKGRELARRALNIARDDPAIIAQAACALAYFGEDIDAMIAMLDRALTLNPNWALGWYLAGMLRMWAGRPDAAIEYVEKSLALSPRATIGEQTHLIGAALVVSRRFEEALPKLLSAANADPSDPAPHRFLAACYAHMGRLSEAQEVVRHLRTITLSVMPDASYLRNDEQREVLLSGLRLAIAETGE